MAAWWIILVVILAVIVLAVILIYNSLVRLKLRAENAWSQIDVQLKRRYDLIPNLVSTVKGYMKHEKGVLTEVTNARAALISGSMKDKAKASNQITEALKSIFAVAESYPQLKANENFKLLQEELSGTESKIAYSRQFYNDSVMELNQAVKTFPRNILAGMFNFAEREFFETAAAEKKNVKVEF